MVNNSIRPGYLVTKRSNSYAKYLVLSIAKGKAQLEPAGSKYEPMQNLLFPNGYPVEKLQRVPYGHLLVSHSNMARIIHYTSLHQTGDFIVAHDCKQINLIDANIDECDIVKAYTTQSGSHYKYIVIDEIKRIVLTQKTRIAFGKIKEQKVPCIRVKFHGL